MFEDGRLTETYGMHLKGKPVIVELKEGSIAIKPSKGGGGTSTNSGDGLTSNYADNNHLNVDNIYLASNHSASNTLERGGYIDRGHPLVIAANDNTISGLVRASGIDTVSSILSSGVSNSEGANVGGSIARDVAGRKSILVTQPAVSVNGVSVSLNSDGPKTVGDIGSNLVRDFIAPHNIGKAQFANPSMMVLSAAGEISEYIQENVIYGINKLPGGEYVLSTVASIVGPIVNTTHNILGGIGNLVLSDAQVEYLKQKYTDLPHGMQVLGRDILDIAKH